MLALEAGDFQLIRGGVAGAVWPREGRGPVGGSAADLLHVNQAGFAVGHAYDDHAMMQKSGVEARNRGFLATVLRTGRSKNALDLANEGTAEPKSAGLIEKWRIWALMFAKRVGVPEMIAWASAS